MQSTQYAVQLVGPGVLRLNTSKEVFEPGPHQILAKVEAVGLCFSDLKVLKQFDQHPRKAAVVAGLAPEVLASMPDYVPGNKPTVLGHEVVCRILKVGSAVKHHKVGERCMVQPDYRPLKTADSNSAFGYNFEGGLQEYLLLDERVVMDAARNERFLIPVEEHLGASQAALVEPWACVEDSYVVPERQTIKAGGRLLVVAEAGQRVEGIAESFAPQGKPAAVFASLPEEGQVKALGNCGVGVSQVTDLKALPDEGFDDIVYFGASKSTLDLLNDKLALKGIMNVVLGGKKIGAKVSVGVGKLHYGPSRWVGTTGFSAAESYKLIPPTGEIRDGDSILVVGAGGPMGQMHVVRNICAGKKNVCVTASDMDQPRLDALMRKALPMAQGNGVGLSAVNVKSQPLEGQFSYFALMAPVGELVEDAIARSLPGGVVNIFAGIPIKVKHDLDLDTMIEKRMFVFGTSGSTIEDMMIVLQKVTAGQLNTNSSVDAISGMAGAIAGIKAVEDRSMAGKIIVYPELHDVGLIPLDQLGEHFPTVAALLDNGQWCKAAEEELLRVAGEQRKP
jgi:threonine dehydrogenase-like Zn-dependent dehydrogenase